MSSNEEFPISKATREPERVRFSLVVLLGAIAVWSLSLAVGRQLGDWLVAPTLMAINLLLLFATNGRVAKGMAVAFFGSTATVVFMMVGLTALADLNISDGLSKVPHMVLVLAIYVGSYGGLMGGSMAAIHRGYRVLGWSVLTSLVLGLCALLAFAAVMLHLILSLSPGNRESSLKWQELSGHSRYVKTAPAVEVDAAHPAF